MVVNALLFFLAPIETRAAAHAPQAKERHSQLLIRSDRNARASERADCISLFQPAHSLARVFLSLLTSILRLVS
jgi:hypothetical protein